MTLTTDPSDIGKFLYEVQAGIHTGAITGIFVVCTGPSGSTYNRISATHMGFNEHLVREVEKALIELKGRRPKLVTQ